MKCNGEEELRSAVESGDESGWIAGGEVAELAGRFAAQASTSDLIEVQRAVAGLVDEHSRDLRAVEALDQAAVEVEPMQGCGSEAAQDRRSILGVVAEVGASRGLLRELAGGLVGWAEVQLEGACAGKVIGERLDQVGAEEAVGDGAGERIGEQGRAEQLDALG